MRKFTALASTAIIAAGTGWISFGQPSYLHAQENAEVNIEVEKKTTKEEGTRGKAVQSSEMQQSGQSQMSQDQQPMQQKQAMSGQASAPQQLLAQATHAAANADKSIVDLLASADRQRIAGANADASQLEQTSSQLRSAWQEKYGSELSIDSIASALGQQQGQADATLNAQVAGQPGSMTASGDMSQPAVGTTGGAEAGNENPIKEQNVTLGSENRAAPRVSTTPPGNEKTVDTTATAQPSGAEGLPETSAAADGVQRNSDSPRLQDVAAADRDAQTASGQMQPAGSGNMTAQSTTYTVPASDGMPASTLNLVKENGQWKIDIDDSVDAQTFHSNLNRHLSQVSNMKDQWPAEAADAQRVLASHVAAALSQGGASNINQ